MSPKINLGVNFIPDAPMPTVIAWCKQAEASGFQWLGVVDSPLLVREFYITYAAYVLSTSRIRFIPMVSNPITRHASVHAGAIFSLNELAPGRVSLGIGSGDSAIYGIGLTQAKVEYLKSYVTAVRGLLDGQEVTWEGKTFKAEWSQWQPPSAVKIYVSAGGPKTVKMASQVADGIIVSLDFGATAENVRYCHELVREGARDAGRDPASIELNWMLPVALAESREVAMDLYGTIGTHLVARATMEGRQIPEEYKPKLKRIYDEWQLATHGRTNPRVAALAKELGVLEFLVERAGGMFGTPEDVRHALVQLQDRGIEHLTMHLRGEDKGAVMKVLEKEVLSHFS